LGEIQGKIKPSDIQLSYIPIWVRVYDLPFKGGYNDTNATMIGKKIGSFIQLDKWDSMEIDKSLRIRVLIDARKPLTQKIKLKMRGGQEDFAEVKYEKLPLFCYYCGKLGHGTKDCDEFFGEESPQKKYGEWLKASPWKFRNEGDKQEPKGQEKSCARKL